MGWMLELEKIPQIYVYFSSFHIIQVVTVHWQYIAIYIKFGLNYLKRIWPERAHFGSDELFILVTTEWFYLSHSQPCVNKLQRILKQRKEAAV